MVTHDAETEELIWAFVAADHAVLVGRAERVGCVVQALAGSDTWRPASERERRRFASRVLFIRWCIRQGTVSDA